MNIRFSDHALEELERRAISPEVARSVVESPQQIVSASGGRRTYQSKIAFGDKTYLVRAIVEETENEVVVITVYRTSQIAKYWSEP